ncbi:MAG: UDP-N-acetylenolpyruvoylglucosamine reductase [Micavibrio sp. TMED2]|nr:MAG: UDP-N-acetylenolpyruvoylglucosamine reductase [Micavibrio sp. TMED2]|tara:strand:+ start:8103 stop:9044 length:942 start_codon:yes stop_codon:yes gene_type:complete
MMAAQQTQQADWRDTLPELRGRVKYDAPIGAMTWFRVGGPAELLFRPADTDDLAAFIRAVPSEVPVTVIGVASNLLVRDGGIDGAAIRLGGGFANITVDGDVVEAGAGALDLNVALTSRDAGLTGLEFLAGIPGTIGGALRMNAGAYGGETKDHLIEVEAVTRTGEIIRVPAAELGLAYRHSDAPADWIYTRAWFRATAGDKDAIAARISEIQSARAQTQPIKSRTGGSTFANPDGHKAWQLVDQAGCRGLKVGGAQVSEQHCNFLINTGDATAADIEALGEEVRRRVRETSGIELRWEIKRIGNPIRSGESA